MATLSHHQIVSLSHCRPDGRRGARAVARRWRGGGAAVARRRRDAARGGGARRRAAARKRERREAARRARGHPGGSRPRRPRRPRRRRCAVRRGGVGVESELSTVGWRVPAGAGAKPRHFLVRYRPRKFPFYARVSYQGDAPKKAKPSRHRRIITAISGLGVAAVRFMF